MNKFKNISEDFELNIFSKNFTNVNMCRLGIVEHLYLLDTNFVTKKILKERFVFNILEDFMQLVPCLGTEVGKKLFRRNMESNVQQK